MNPLDEVVRLLEEERTREASPQVLEKYASVSKSMWPQWPAELHAKRASETQARRLDLLNKSLAMVRELRSGVAVKDLTR